MSLTKFLPRIYCFCFLPRSFNKSVILQNYQKPQVAAEQLLCFLLLSINVAINSRIFQRLKEWSEHDVVGQRVSVVSSKGNPINWQLCNWKFEQKYHILSISRRGEKCISNFSLSGLKVQHDSVCWTSQMLQFIKIIDLEQQAFPPLKARDRDQNI